MSAAGNLPTEVHHAILDHMADDLGMLDRLDTLPAEHWFSSADDFPKSSEPLYQCALVCRSWLDYSRKVFWANYPFPILTSKFIGHTERLMDIVAQPTCTFTRHVSCLLIGGPERAFFGLTTLTAFGESQQKIDLFLNQLSALSVSPRSLFMGNLSLNKMKESTILVFHSFSQVEVLNLSKISFRTLRSLCTFAANFPGLRDFKIQLYGRLWKENGLGLYVEPGDPGFEALLRLDISDIPLSGFTGYLLRHPSYIQELTVTAPFPDQESNTLNDLLKHIGPSLRKLFLRSKQLLPPRRPIGNGQNRVPSVSLTYNSSLKHLEMPTVTISPEPSIETSWLVKLLDSIESTALQSVQLTMRYPLFGAAPCTDVPHQFDWAALDGALNRLQTLRRFLLKINTFSESVVEADLRSEMRQNLPMLNASGVLEVE